MIASWRSVTSADSWSATFDEVVRLNGRAVVAGFPRWPRTSAARRRSTSTELDLTDVTSYEGMIDAFGDGPTHTLTSRGSSATATRPPLLPGGMGRAEWLDDGVQRPAGRALPDRLPRAVGQQCRACHRQRDGVDSRSVARHDRARRRWSPHGHAPGTRRDGVGRNAHAAHQPGDSRAWAARGDARPQLGGHRLVPGCGRRARRARCLRRRRPPRTADMPDQRRVQGGSGDVDAAAARLPRCATGARRPTERRRLG